jgi:hypothetical protein
LRNKLFFKSYLIHTGERSNRSNRRSQIFSLDMILGMIVFVFILISAFWAWHITENRINYIRDIRDMTVIAKYSTNELVTSRGFPSRWQYVSNISEIKSIGLVEYEENIASIEKISKLIYLGKEKYNETKELLGIKGSGYEFYLEIGENSTGLPYQSSRDVVAVDRAMILTNGSIINIKMKVWRE